MIRKLRWLPLGLLVAVVGGCATLGYYTVDEGELESYLQQQVKAFDRQQLEAGSPLSLSLKDVDIELGPEDRDVAILDVNGEIALNVLMARVPVAVVLKVEGAPVYSSRDKAVYVRRLKLLDSQIDSPYFKGDIKPVTETAMRVLAQMLETTPVYRLTEADASRLGFFGKVPVDIKVGKGKLLFVPAE